MQRFMFLKKGLMWLGSVFLLTVWLLAPGAVMAAEDKAVTEEILEIMLEERQITRKQYNELMKKAKEEKQQDQDFRLYWKDGIRLDSKDKQFKLKFGGRIMTDWAFINPDDDTEDAFPDLKGHGVEFRRARLYFQGTVYDSVDFKAQYDFAGGDPEFKDVYIGLRNLPIVGHFKAGHMKEPFSLEELTSSKYITFMERGLPNDAFVPGRETGFMIHNAAFEKRMTWAAGAFQDADDFGDAFSDISDYDVSARVTALPWYEEKGKRLVHVGFSYSHEFRSGADNPVRFRARPEVHTASDRLINSGFINADDVDLLNPEAALVFGPLSLQGEYFYVSVDRESGDDPEFNGFYVFGSYFLTGENRRYKTSAGAFSRVKPKENFHPTKGGWGAWEVGVRYSYVDLSDEDIDGGEEANLTVGLNWYMNPNTRIMFNYVRAMVEDRIGVLDDGDTNAYQVRFQIDF